MNSTGFNNCFPGLQLDGVQEPGDSRTLENLEFTAKINYIVRIQKSRISNDEKKSICQPILNKIFAQASQKVIPFSFNEVQHALISFADLPQEKIMKCFAAHLRFLEFYKQHAEESFDLSDFKQMLEDIHALILSVDLTAEIEAGNLQKFAHLKQLLLNPELAIPCDAYEDIELDDELDLEEQQMLFFWNLEIALENIVALVLRQGKSLVFSTIELVAIKTVYDEIALKLGLPPMEIDQDTSDDGTLAEAITLSLEVIPDTSDDATLAEAMALSMEVVPDTSDDAELAQAIELSHENNDAALSFDRLMEQMHALEAATAISNFTQAYEAFQLLCVEINLQNKSAMVGDILSEIESKIYSETPLQGSLQELQMRLL